MRQAAPWIAFLVMLFALVGLCGAFASYAPSIPLERGIARAALLDRAAAAPDGPALEQLRPALASLAKTVIDGPGPFADRLASARATVAEERRRETASVAYRVRLMLLVVTAVAAVLGAGILLLVRRMAAQTGALTP